MSAITDTHFTYAVVSDANKTLSIIGVNPTRYPTSLVNWGTFPQIPPVYGGTNTTYNGAGNPANAYKITEIGVSAFESRTAFSSTTLTPTFLPANLTRIGNKAFLGVALQGTLTIPENIASIGEMSFYNCTLITNVVIGSVVNSDVISHLSDLTAVLNQEITARNIADDGLHLLKAPIHNAVLTGTAAFPTANITTATISTANATTVHAGNATVQTATIAGQLDVSGRMTFSGSTTTAGQWDFTNQPKYNANAVATEAYVNTNVAAIAGDMSSTLSTLLELTTAIDTDPSFASTVVNGNAVLLASLVAETGARSSAVSGLSSTLGSAAASLTHEDSLLSTALSSEVSGRVSAVSSLHQATSTAAASLGAADAALSAGISTEISARSSAVLALSNTLGSAAASLSLADSSLSTVLSSEVSGRVSAVSSLSQATSTAAASLGAADAALSAGISTEISARSSSVSALSSALGSAAASLSLADSSLITALSSEATGRGSALGSVSSSVSGATIQAQSSIQSLSGALNAETDALSNGTNLLSASVMTAATAIASVHAVLHSGTTVETTARETAILGVSVYASNVVSGLVGLNSSLSGAISAEISVRTSQVGSISSELSTAVPSLTVVASGLSSAVAAEIQAATSALNAELSAIKGNAPASLDTLREIADELNNNPSLAPVVSVLAVATTTSNAMSAEIVSRESAITSVASALSVAAASLLVADTSIAAGLSAEVGTRIASVLSVSGSLTSATAAFSSANGLLSGSLASEISVRAASVATVTAELGTASASLATAHDTLSTAISAESVGRAISVVSFSTSLSAANSSLAAANSVTTSDLSAEIANRTAAISAVALALSASASGMQTAISAASDTVVAVSSNAALKTTTSYLSAQIANIVGGAPATLDTIAELGAALNNQNNLAGSLTTVLANKAAAADVSALSTALTQKANQSDYASLSVVVGAKATATAVETASISATVLVNTVNTLVAEVSALKNNGVTTNPDAVVVNGVSLTDLHNWTKELYVKLGLTNADGTINEKLNHLANPSLANSDLEYEYDGNGAINKVIHVITVQFDKGQKSVTVTGGVGNLTTTVSNLVLNSSNQYVFAVPYVGNLAFYEANKTTVSIVALDTPYKLAPLVPTVIAVHISAPTVSNISYTQRSAGSYTAYAATLACAVDANVSAVRVLKPDLSAFPNVVTSLPTNFNIKTGGSNWRDYIPVTNYINNPLSWTPNAEFHDVNLNPNTEIAKQFSYFAAYWLNANRASNGQSFSIGVVAGEIIMWPYYFPYVGNFTFTATTDYPVTAYTGSLSFYNSGATYTLTPQTDGINAGIAASISTSGGIKISNLTATNGNASPMVTFVNTVAPVGLVIVAQGNATGRERLPSATQTLTPPPLLLDANGTTIKYVASVAAVPTAAPLFIQANPRGTGTEWFAVVKQGMKAAISSYASGTSGPFIPPGQSVAVPFNNIVTTLMTDMSSLFFAKPSFNGLIASWDTSAVTNMDAMFSDASAFNQPIGAWNTAAVTTMRYMFYGAIVFNQPIGTWNTNAVTNMFYMFSYATAFNQPIGTWNTGAVTNLDYMFYGATVFNQNISGWNVAAVVTKPPTNFSNGSALTAQNTPVWFPIVLVGTTIKYVGNAAAVPTSAPLFIQANPRGTGVEWFAVVKQGMKDAISDYASGTNSLFIPPGQSAAVEWKNIVTTLMTDMSGLFNSKSGFNEPIASWDTSAVTSMKEMFIYGATFNQPIGAWNTSAVTNMNSMFFNATVFNQPIGAWNTAAVTNMGYMFYGATTFNQPIGAWNTAAVTDMNYMFFGANAFNQNITGWNVAAVSPKPPANFISTANSALTAPNTPVWFPIVLDANGTTIKYVGSAATVPTAAPLFIQANPRGTGVEWFAVVKQGMKAAISDYAGGTSGPFIPPGQSVAVPFNNIVTTLMTNMSSLFTSKSSFNDLIESWDTGAVTDMSQMFYYANGFNKPIGAWNTGAVTTMSNMFVSANVFNQSIGAWNTAAVTNMGYMFYSANIFNQSIGAWNTAAVTNMNYMFYNATSFNQPIGAWNTGAVTDMSEMFYGATAFNQPIGAWNTGAVTNMSYMFVNANLFNQAIGAWNTAAVTNMGYMFYQATAFNQPIGTWNTAAVTTMGSMFYGATAFNQPIGTWNTAAVTNMGLMFYGATAFNQNISAWNVGAVVTKPPTQFSSGSALTAQNTPVWFPIVQDANGTTIKYVGSAAAVPTAASLFVQANPRGTGVEWFAVVKQGMKTAISSYASGTSGPFIPPGQSVAVPFNNIVTTLMTDMNSLFYYTTAFNQPIASWDTGAVTTMIYMFYDATAFNQPIGTWNTAAVTDMSQMFYNAAAFNQNISGWNVGALVTKPPAGFSSGSALTAYNSPVWATWTFTYSGTYSGSDVPTQQLLSDDPNVNTGWGSNLGTNPYIQADFGSVKTTTSITVGPRPSWGWIYLNGADVQYSSDGSDWQTVTSNINPTNDQGLSIITYTTSISARYVRIIRLNSGLLGVGTFYFTFA